MSNIIWMNCRVCGKRIIHKKSDLLLAEVKEGFCSGCMDVADDLMDETTPEIDALEALILKEGV